MGRRTFLWLGAAALGLAGCAAIENRATRRESEWEASYPPVGRRLGTSGRQIHALEMGRARGQAPDLVLIHGASGNLREFTFDLAGRLAADFRIVAVDRPGLGWSDDIGPEDTTPAAQAALLRETLAPFGLRQPVLLGHSYGGAVALAWALDAPQTVGALVLVAAASHPWPSRTNGWYGFNQGPLGQGFRQLVAAFVPESAAGNAARAVFAPSPVPEGYLEHLGAGLSLRRNTLDANTRQVNALREALRAQATRYADLTLPIEILHGTRDRITPLEDHSRPLADTLPHARLTVLEGAGHMPHHSHAPAVVAAVRRAAAAR